jgi:hypothetical protein
MNSKAQAIADQLKTGTVLELIGRPDCGTYTVARIEAKSVWFDNGQHFGLRSLHRMRIVSA